MSEAGSDRSSAKRDRADSTVGTDVVETINVDTSLVTDNSPISPPATVHDNSSNEVTHGDVYVPHQDPFNETSQTEDLNTNVQPLDPLLEVHQAASTEVLEQTSVAFGNNDMFMEFDITNAIPTPSMLFGNPFETTDWLNSSSDQSFPTLFLQNDLTFDTINDIWFDQASYRIPQQQQQQQPVASLPTPASSLIDQSAVAELYSRSHSPAIDKDAVEPREYVPVSIEFDAQLTFPDLSHLVAEDVDGENLAHVEEIPDDVGRKISQAAIEMQNSSNFPRFRHLAIPPTPVLNAWVQLYFEYFHPVLPILHKSTFSSSKRHWLLVFTVAAIGAHFSSIKEAQACSRAMHELIRRQTSTMVSVVIGLVCIRH